MVSAAKKHRKQCVAKLLSKRLLEDHVAALRACVKEHKNKRAPARTPDGRLRVFSDCAGISSELIALKLLGFSSENLLWVGGSETDAVKRVLMQCVHRCCDMPTKKECVEKDMFKRNLNETSACDLYIAGYPCPAYSRLGKKNGAQDAHGRGLLVFEGLKYIAKWKPSIVVFENVVGFLNKKHEYTHKVMRKCFQALKYKVYMQVLNTKDHGVPQSRPRCYFVAFRTSKKVSFRFPKALKCSKLVHFLDKAEGDDKVDLTTYEEKYGEQIWQEDLVLDIGSSAGWQSKMVVCPCLTRGRCLQKGYYLPKQLRRLSGAELFGHVGRQGSLPVLKVTFHLGLLGLVESPCGRAVAWHGQRQAKPLTLFHVVFGAKSCFQCQFYKVTDTDDSLIYKVTLRAWVLQPARLHTQFLFKKRVSQFRSRFSQ